MKDKFKKLYADSFTDSKEYIEFYFNRRFTTNIEYIQQDDIVISELFYFDRQLSFFDKGLPASFISGACTDARYRGKGYMSKLLKTTFDNMRSRGIVVSYLYPFSHAFYEKFGFVTYSFMQKACYDCNRRKATSQDMQKTMQLYYEHTRDFNLYTMRKLEDFEELYDGITIDGGDFFMLEKDGKIIGYNYYDTFSEQNEFVSVDSSIITKNGYECFIPSQNGDKYSMIRCINVVDMLRFCKIKNDASFCITDSLIEANNISVAVTKKGVEIVPKGEISMDISTLTSHCLGTNCNLDLFDVKNNINFEKY